MLEFIKKIFQTSGNENILDQITPIKVPEVDDDSKNIGKEVIDDWFWLKWAKLSIENNINALDNQLSNIQKLIVAILSLNILVGLFDISFHSSKSLLIILIISIPIPVLIMAYFFSGTGIKIILSNGFDPRDPDASRDQYSKIVDQKILNLKWAKRFTLLGFTLLSIALVLSSVKKLNPELFENLPNFDIGLYDFEKTGERQMSITGHLQPNDSVFVYIEHYNLKDTCNKEIKVEKKFFRNSKSGDFQFSIPVNPKATNFSVRVEWPEGNEWKSSRKIIDLNKDDVQKKIKKISEYSKSLDDKPMSMEDF